MKILTKWLRAYLPGLPVDDAQLAEDLTLRGIAVDGVFHLGADNSGNDNGSVLEMDITTNRVDAMNHYGVAREAAAIYGLTLSPIEVVLPKSKKAAAVLSVRIEAEDACGRFTARVLRGVKVGQTGGDAGVYFDLLGQKKISSIVDATNYVWLAMGQPTHAFDLDKIEGGIIVRRAVKGERLKTLDGVERVLNAEDLVVADHVKALSLAGVMGGWDTMITPETKNVVVEAAWFEPTAVRRTARRHGLHTDASHRFERGADFDAVALGSALVSNFILANGGDIEGELVDVRVPKFEARTTNRPAVELSLTEVHRILGMTIDPEGITADVVEDVLAALGCRLVRHPERESAWMVTLPSWRLDVARDIDLIEEIARVYGYNRFANTLPDFGGGVRALPWADKESAVRRTLLAGGLHEAISSTFCSAEDARLTAPQPGLLVPVGNPLSDEAGMMRPSLLPGMLAMIAGNLHRDASDVRLFETGTVFSGSTDKVEERPHLALGLAGALPEQSALHAARVLEFHDLKGLVEQIVSRFQIRSIYFDSFPAESGLTPGYLHPYRGARVVAEGLTVGWFGEVHPREAAARKLKEKVLVGEIYLDRLYRFDLRRTLAREISRYQAVRRDLSLVVGSAVRWEVLDRAIAALQLTELVEWRAREVFRDPKLGGKEYALLVGVTFQAQDRTLREEELQDYTAQVVNELAAAGARLRVQL